MLLNIHFFYIFLIVLWLQTEVAVAERQKECWRLEKVMLALFEVYRSGNPHVTNLTHYKLERHQRSGRWFGNDWSWFVIDNAIFTGFENAKATGITYWNLGHNQLGMEIRFTIPVVNFFSKNYYASHGGGTKANITLFNVQVIADGVLDWNTWVHDKHYDQWISCSIKAIFERQRLFFEGTEVELNKKIFVETIHMLREDLDKTAYVYKNLVLETARSVTFKHENGGKGLENVIKEFLRRIGASADAPDLSICYEDRLKFKKIEKNPDLPDWPFGESINDKESWFSKIFG